MSFEMPDEARTAVTGYLESHLDDTLDELAELVAIPSVSWPSHDMSHVQASAEWVADTLRRLTMFERIDIVRAPIGDSGVLGQPAVVARREPRHGRPTVLLYAHHDVQPAGESDSWSTPLFELTIRDGRAFGRGAADDKAGVMSHVAALRALRELVPDPDLGLVVFIEGEEEYGSPSFGSFLRNYRDRLAADVIVVADSTNWDVDTPALTVSLRGMVALEVTVETLDHAVHSGMFGGAVPDAMLAMNRLLASLHHDDGSVAVAGLTSGHRGAGPDFSEERLRDESGLLSGVSPIGRGDILERIWTRPAITVTGMDVPPVDEASNTLLPTVRACVSVRVAPGQSVHLGTELVSAHLLTHAPFGARVSVTPRSVGQGFLADEESPSLARMRDAMRAAWKAEPVDMGVGGSIPFIAEFLEVFPDAQIVVTGIEDPDTRAHSPNESLHIAGFVKATAAEALFLASLNGDASATVG